MIYLDTHVILWLYLRKGEGLSENARQLIEYEAEILISPMVLLELDYLYEISRTTLGSAHVFKYLYQQIDLQNCSFCLLSSTFCHMYLIMFYALRPAPFALSLILSAISTFVSPCFKLFTIRYQLKPMSFWASWLSDLSAS
jgi:hypothetical protein